MQHPPPPQIKKKIIYNVFKTKFDININFHKHPISKLNWNENNSFLTYRFLHCSLLSGFIFDTLKISIIFYRKTKFTIYTCIFSHSIKILEYLQTQILILMIESINPSKLGDPSDQFLPNVDLRD